jgi:ComF family protein
MSEAELKAKLRLTERLRDAAASWFANRRSTAIPATASYLARAECDLLFPPRCVLCLADLPAEHHVSMLCCDCITRLAPEVWVGCQRCGGEIASEKLVAARCPSCEKSRLWFDTVTVLGSYHAGLKDVMVRMKRPAYEALTIAMGRLLAHRRQRNLVDLDVDLIVPIPMHWTRWLARGINSPELVGGCLSHLLRVPLRRRTLARRRNTAPQKDLPPAERFRNLEGAFRIRRGNNLRGARVLLVDDILTTGATCSEAAKMLKQAGAATVAVAVVARAQGAKHQNNPRPR